MCSVKCLHIRYSFLLIINQKSTEIELLEVRGVDIRITWADKHFIEFERRYKKTNA